MRLLKQCFLSLVLLPLISFADKDYTFYDVSQGCYFAFRTAFGMLPELTDAMNEKAGQTLLVISNVNTPLKNPSTFTMTIEQTPMGTAVGDYALYQKYTNGTLYLNWTEYPDAMDAYSFNLLWALVEKGFEACTL